MNTLSNGFNKIVCFSPFLLMALLVMPVLGGLLGVILPAVGWFPALDHTVFSLNGFHQLWQTPGIGRMILLSGSTSFISTVVAFLLTLIILASYFNSPWLGYIQRLLVPILVIPHAAAAIAIGFLVTPSGMISRLVSPWLSGWSAPPDWLYPHDTLGLSIMLSLVVKELPFLLLMALGVLAQPHLGHTLRAHHKVAMSLGYGPATAFFKVVLPSLYPYLRLPLLAVLAYASASVEMPLILGPNNPPTLAVAIMQWFHDVDLSLRIKASAGAILQIQLTLLLLASWWLLERCVGYVAKPMLTNGKRHDGGSVLPPITHGITGVLFSIIGLALLGLVLWSVAGFWRFPDALPQQFVLQHWQSALQHMHRPLMDTLSIAFCATALAITLAVLTLEAEQHSGKTLSRFGTVILYLPLLVPGIAFLLGLVWLLEQINSQHTFINVVFAHLLFVLPYVFLSLANSYRRLDSRFSQVAASLGATKAKIFFRIKLPMLVVPICIASALGLAISFSQYLPTLLAGGGRIETITTEAVSLANGGSRRISAVYALVQMLLPALGFLLAWLLAKILTRQPQQG